jgi:hypothetical protein
MLDLIDELPEDIRSTMVALCWYASQFNPNCICENRIGLAQLSTDCARLVGFRGTREALFEPKVNLSLASAYIAKFGLIDYCGFWLAHELHNIVRLALWLDRNRVSGAQGIEKELTPSKG